jgi:hypothetical protein
MLVAITFSANKRFGLADIYRGEWNNTTVGRKGAKPQVSMGLLVVQA